MYNTSKKLYHLQISEIFTSSKNENFKNYGTAKKFYYILQGLLHFEFDIYIFNKVFYIFGEKLSPRSSRQPL